MTAPHSEKTDSYAACMSSAFEAHTFDERYGKP